MHQSVNNLVFFLFFINLYFIFIETKSSEKTSFSFPTVKRIPKTWSFKSTNGNVSYTEDYYWMESVNKTDKDLSKFVNDQSILTESYMRKCKNRDAIVKSIQDANKYNYIGNLALYGEDHNPIYVYSFQGANDQRALWYIATMDEFQASKKTNFYPPPGKMFLNESLLSKDNSASIEQVVISPNTKIFAYLTTTTSTFGTWYFRETSSPLVTAKTTPPGGEGKLPLEIPLCTYPIQWFNDNSGFFYPQHLDDKGGTVLEHRDKIRFHKWNTDYSQDITIFDAGNLGEGVPTTYFFTQITDDNRWLIVSGYKGSDAYLLSYATFLPKQTISENMKWIVLAPKYEFTMWPVTVIDDWYYFQTDYQTINGRVAKMFMDSSKAKTVKKFNELQDRPKIIEVIKERKDAQLATQNTAVYAIAHDKAILVYQENGQNTYYLYDLLSGKKVQHLLANESISSAALNVYGQSNLAQASFSSFDTPEKVYEFKFVKDHIEVSIVSTQIIEGAS